MTSYARVRPGASLLTAWSSPRASTSSATLSRQTALIIGATPLAAARAFACLEAGYDVVVVHAPNEVPDDELAWRETCRELVVIACPALLGGDFGAWLDAQPDLLADIALVFVVDTLRSLTRATRSTHSAARLRQACFERRLPVNVADIPALCDFAVPTSQRLPLLDGTPSSLQVAITTNASACRLAARLRRMLVAALPKGAASAVHRIAELRTAIRAAGSAEDSCEEAWSALEPVNAPVEQLSPRRCPSKERGRTRPRPMVMASAPSVLAPPTPPHTPPAVPSAGPLVSESRLSAVTRMRFISQISEYWPIDRLAILEEKEMARLLDMHSLSAAAPEQTVPPSFAVPPVQDSQEASATSTIGEKAVGDQSPERTRAAPSRHALELTAPAKREAGRVYLVGSGPGSPALLTCAARDIITRQATVVLSDKLVPAPVLALIPATTKLVIAQKFPGNAEGAQDELMRLGLEALQRGETVVRLKQGDPLLYGRGGEEILFFRRHGYESIVIPGVTSALAAPLLAGIPVTQRGVADSLVLATGVGRAGAAASLPVYDRPRTLVLLMSLARIDKLAANLLHARYPPYLPCAIVERASSPDQRAIAATVETIAAALARVEQRPPGLLIVGWCVLALAGRGDMTVLDTSDAKTDEARVQDWLQGRPYIISEGLPSGWSELVEQHES